MGLKKKAKKCICCPQLNCPKCNHRLKVNKTTKLGFCTWPECALSTKLRKFKLPKAA
jgi:hypothetical protein